MDTRRLRYFVDIVDAGSITRAASRVGVAQPALSQQLAILETEVKAKLLDRSRAGVALTPAGEILYARAKLILRQIDDLTGEIHSRSEGLTGTVLACIPPTLADVLTVPILSGVQRQHPAIRLKVLERGSAQVLSLLRDGDVDIAVSVRRPERVEEVEAELLFIEPLMLAVPDVFGPFDATDLRELSELPWLTSLAPHAARTQSEAAFAQAGLPYRFVAELESMATMLRAVQAGVGLAVLPLALCGYARALGGIRIMPFGVAPTTRPVFLCMRRDPPAGAATQFVAGLIRQLSADYAKSVIS
jgi:LysR family nitrogen assimilation transcriptional regulator